MPDNIKYRTTVWAGELQRLRAMERELRELREFIARMDHDRMLRQPWLLGELNAVLRVHE